jgi:alkanesulfonate monooxygenase SsuD/methylene tetrahydromethanopterin reductase-like flavin-dependent oxidoreductase (luciferase family)
MTVPHPVPLSVLDLSPIPSGSSTADALHNTIDLACRTEAAGYRRYWVAEHHLNPGVVGSAPAVLIGAVAGATSRIRVGSGAVLTGHQTMLSVVEEFGLLDALYPGRIDLGLGRSGQRRQETLEGKGPTPPKRTQNEVVDGLLLPPPFPVASLIGSPRFAVQAKVLQQPGAQTPDFADQVDELFAYVRGDFSLDGVAVHAAPGEGAGFEVWILGSSAGQSAQLAGALGLPFGATW